MLFSYSVADPGFPRGGGANPQGGGANLLCSQKCPKTWMEMKEFRPREGARVPGTPLRSANGISYSVLTILGYEASVPSLSRYLSKIAYQKV